MSHENPLGQTISLLTRIQGKGVPAGTLEAHFSAGLISDLFEVGDPGAIDRDAFRKLLGLSPLEMLTEIDFGQPLEAMIAAGKYDWTNSEITAARFPVECTGKKKFRNKLFHFNRNISSQDVVTTMKKEKFTPGGHVHGLAFGATFPDEQRKYPIACLGSSARVFGGRGVVCLDRDDAERSLRLRRWDGGWHGLWRFLGVQEVSEA